MRRKRTSSASESLIFNERLKDPTIKNLLLRLRAANVLDPEYTAIKRILEWGIRGSAMGLDATYAKQQAKK